MSDKDTIIKFFLDRNVNVIDNFIDRFTPKRTIYNKIYKEISLCYDNINKKEVVVKQILLSGEDEMLNFTIREFHVHEKMSHLTNKVPYLYEYGLYHSLDDKIYGVLIMEFIEGCTMDAFIRKGYVTEEIFIELGKQLFDIVTIMHNANIIHRDIKPENIIINENPRGVFDLKLIDFGFAHILPQVDNEDIKTISGTLEYLSPEFFEFKEKLFCTEVSMDLFSITKTEMLKSTDIWACGITIYELLEYRLPWKCNTVANLQREVLQNDKISFTCTNSELVEIVKGALRKHPKIRSCAHDMYKKFSEYTIKTLV